MNRESEFKAVDKNGHELKIGDYVKWRDYADGKGTIMSVYGENSVKVWIEEHLRDYCQSMTTKSTSLEYVRTVSDEHLKFVLDK